MILLEKVRKTIEKFSMLGIDDKVVVGVSGGPDSVALLHILWRFKDLLNISLTVAHLNHGLRGKDALSDQESVSELSSKLGIPIRAESVKVHDFAKNNNLTIEDAGRRLRYDFFRRVAEEVKANKVAVGHNLDDQSETVLMRIIRGTGIVGIAGIPPVRDLTGEIKIIRPLIEITREEIIRHLKAGKLETKIDRTNFARTYFRNKVRLELLPLLEKKYNRSIKNNLVNLAKIGAIENDYFSNVLLVSLPEVIKEKTEDRVVLIKEILKNLHLALKRRVIRECIRILSDTTMTFEHIEEIIDNLYKNNNLELELPDGIKILFIYDSVIITKEKEKNPVNYEYKLKVPGNTEIKEINLTLNSEFIENIDFSLIKRDNSKAYFDADLLKFPLLIRNRREGDKFIPFGLSGTKKIKKFFIDKKISPEHRDEIPIVSDELGDIIWIVGYRTDNRFRITDKTKNILKLGVN